MWWSPPNNSNSFRQSTIERTGWNWNIGCVGIVKCTQEREYAFVYAFNMYILLGRFTNPHQLNLLEYIKQMYCNLRNSIFWCNSRTMCSAHEKRLTLCVLREKLRRHDTRHSKRLFRFIRSHAIFTKFSFALRISLCVGFYFLWFASNLHLLRETAISKVIHICSSRTRKIFALHSRRQNFWLRRTYTFSVSSFCHLSSTFESIEKKKLLSKYLMIGTKFEPSETKMECLSCIALHNDRWKFPKIKRALWCFP